MKTYIGVDLGATKLRIGEIDEAGRILHTQRYNSDCRDQHLATQCIMDCLEAYFAGRPEAKTAAGMGVGLVGRGDWESGMWLGIDSRRNETIPLASMLADRWGMPCRIDNDVRSATRAEMRFGYGQQYKNLVYINAGTGIAAGTVIEGRVTRGGHINAGEVGHTAVGVNVGTVCGCGRTNCVETIASGSGIDTCARLLRGQYPDTQLAFPPEGQRVPAQEVYRLANTDALCEMLVENAAAALANLVMNLVRTTDPEVVVLGGGMVQDGFLYERILPYLNPPTMRFVTGGVVLTRLDPAYAGVIGAAAVGME